LYQSASFDDTGKASTYWSTYLILRFNTIPDSVDVDVMDLPGQPFLAAVGI